MCTDLRRLSRERLRRPDAANAVSHPSLRQYLLRRWRTMLSCANARGIASTLLDCIEGCGVPRSEPVPPPLHYYELQAARLTGF